MGIFFSDTFFKRMTLEPDDVDKTAFIFNEAEEDKENKNTKKDNSDEDNEDLTSGVSDAADDESNDDNNDSEPEDDNNEVDTDNNTGNEEDSEDLTSGVSDAADDESNDDSESEENNDTTTDNEDETEEDSDLTNGIDGAADDESNDDSESTDSTEDTDDDTTDDDTNKELKDIESELFSNLTPEQINIRNTVLKKNFIEIYKTIGNILIRINDISKTEDNNETLQFVTEKLLDLRDMVDFNITTAYQTRTYIENNIIYQQCLSVLNAISDILENLESHDQNIINMKTDEEENDDEELIVDDSDDINIDTKSL